MVLGVRALVTGSLMLVIGIDMALGDLALVTGSLVLVIGINMAIGVLALVTGILALVTGSLMQVIEGTCRRRRRRRRRCCCCCRRAHCRTTTTRSTAKNSRWSCGMRREGDASTSRPRSGSGCLQRFSRRRTASTTAKGRGSCGTPREGDASTRLVRAKHNDSARCCALVCARSFMAACTPQGTSTRIETQAPASARYSRWTRCARCC